MSKKQKKQKASQQRSKGPRKQGGGGSGSGGGGSSKGTLTGMRGALQSLAGGGGKGKAPSLVSKAIDAALWLAVIAAIGYFLYNTKCS